MTVSERGTGQGAVISPLLANVYLHYVLDLWAERWRRHEATGDMIIVRYADDFIVGFQHEVDARRFLDAMRERLQPRSMLDARFLVRATAAPLGQRFRSGGAGAELWGLFGAPMKSVTHPSTEACYHFPIRGRGTSLGAVKRQSISEGALPNRIG